MGASYGSQLARQSRAVLNGGSAVPFDTYATAKTVINPEDRVELGKNFWKPGRGVVVRVRGGLKNTTGNPTVQFLLKLGPLTSQVTVFDSGLVQLNATAHALLPFKLDITLRADKDNHGDGTLTKLYGLGELQGRMFTATAAQVDDAQGDQRLLVPQTAPALGSGFDDSITNVLDFHVGFSASNSANGVQIWDYAVFDEGLPFSAAQ